jgi:hypothetical protein
MSGTEAVMFDKSGFAIGEVVATIDRQWVLNRYGEAKFEVSISQVEAKPNVFEKGNFILLREDGLPDWAGYVDTPEPWGNGKVALTCYSAERLLELRPGVVDTLYGTGGSIFVRAIEMANSWGDTLIRPGSIYKGGTSREESFAPSNQIYDDILRIANRSGNDWDITPDFRNGKLTLLGNWYETKRRVIDFALTEGVNMEAKDGTLEYEGPIWNYVYAFGNAATWASREAVEVWDDDSIHRYGLKATGLGVESNEEATIRAHAEAYLAYYKDPRRRLDVTVTNLNGTFGWLRIGNVPDVELIRQGLEDGEVGFTAAMEIGEMTYQHGAGRMDLVLVD